MNSLTAARLTSERVSADDVIAEGFPRFAVVAPRRGFPGDVIADDLVSEGFPCMISLATARRSCDTSTSWEWES